MGRNWLFTVFFFGAIMSCVANLPSGGSHRIALENAANDSRISRPDSSADESSDESYGGNGVKLDRHWDGHFYADAEVNGQRIHFLVDTGATVIALSREDARRAGIATSIGMPGVVGEGASGAIHGEVATLDRVTLGSTTAHDMEAVVLDGGSRSLLGQSFLSKFASVEIHGDTMVLE
jgi:aspartyl protease family protein